MFKRLLPLVLTATTALTSLSASAQTSPAGRTRAFCAFDEQQEAYFAAHPGARLLYNATNQQLASMPQQRGGTALPTVTVPVVVHVIHAGGVDNVSDRQIASAIAQMNTDYQKLNADTSTTIPLFRPIAANLGFQFKLAKKDPSGNCTTGITRHYAPSLINDDRSGAVKNFVIWDSNRYLNIWLVSTIGTPTAGGGIILGYAQFPGQSATTDGLVIRHDYFGNQGTSTVARALERTATHEIGHYFGLLHPWGNGTVETPGNCSDTDFVADTPPTNGTFTCNLAYAPCGQIANVQNFMDYASCATMFTQGQKARMLNVLQTIRTSLTTSANLVATGTNDGYVAPDCAPLAAFAA
ncbi:M43 family zinc metalloprotease, partial [Hymenobacter negativus]